MRFRKIKCSKSLLVRKDRVLMLGDMVRYNKGEFD